MFHNLFKRYKYDNTREYVRLPAYWRIKCELMTPTENHKILSTKDVSAGGISAMVPEMIPADTRIQVEIHVPPIDRVIIATAQVVRCQPAQKGFELGIRFLEINAQDQAALKQAIEKHYGPAKKARQERGAWWRNIQ